MLAFPTTSRNSYNYKSQPAPRRTQGSFTVVPRYLLCPCLSLPSSPCSLGPGPHGIESKLSSWAAGYRRNYSAMVRAVQRELNGVADQLTLVSDYACGTRGRSIMSTWNGTVCIAAAALATREVQSIGRELGVSVADVHSLFLGHEADLIKKEYLYHMHPASGGGCVYWHALVRADPRRRLPCVTQFCRRKMTKPTHAQMLANKSLWGCPEGAHESRALT